MVVSGRSLSAANASTTAPLTAKKFASMHRPPKVVRCVGTRWFISLLSATRIGGNSIPFNYVIPWVVYKIKFHVDLLPVISVLGGGGLMEYYFTLSS